LRGAVPLIVREIFATIRALRERGGADSAGVRAS
jgi:hypothetical protein